METTLEYHAHFVYNLVEARCLQDVFAVSLALLLVPYLATMPKQEHERI